MHTDKDCEFCRVLKKVMGDGGCASIGNFISKRAVEHLMSDVDLLYSKAEEMAKNVEITKEELETFGKLCTFSFAYAVSKIPSMVMIRGDGPLDPLHMIKMIMTNIDNMDEIDNVDTLDTPSKGLN